MLQDHPTAKKLHASLDIKQQITDNICVFGSKWSLKNLFILQKYSLGLLWSDFKSMVKSESSHFVTWS